ncbi:MAG: hypothetical protein QM809_18355 [Gordonia sp. (in: high G+C Gram-positive bacteria)]|uniref:relaxase/mobilization nuclease domain-containing protein n=1 Tax=Gordonia sp. (in: high G+C Gram-positive bacteria) TaxID=84139 RepID=UPI0039E22176
MTTLSGSTLYDAGGFDDYLSSAASHDQDNPHGASARVELMSTLGDCSARTFMDDLRRTRVAYGKAHLEVEAYSYVLSHAHEEADPLDDEAGRRVHELAREWAADAFGGRQVKLVTQRDNGRWEGDGDDRIWVEGHWHTHIVVANVAEEPVTLRWTDAEGVVRTKHYRAGRAIDGDLKNIYRLRGITDDVVLRRWGYDNKAYVEACRRFNEGSASKQDLAQRAERGYSTYDQVRVKLREARSQADSWTDYVTRLQAVAVDVRVRGKSGVSYAWVGDDGLERKARARGKAGIGAEFTRVEVEKQCATNAETLARGESLEAPEPVLVMPSTTVLPDRPKPVYLTPDGRPPWEQADAREDYVEYVKATGGTYEGRAAEALGVDAETAARAGVDIGVETGTVVATVDAGDGPVGFEIDAGIVERRLELESAEARFDRHVEQASAALDSRAAAIETDRTAAVAAGRAEGLAAGRADAVTAVREETRQARAEAEKTGYIAGERAGRTAAETVWATETEPALRRRVRTEVESEVRAELKEDVDAAAEDRRAAAAERRQAADEAARIRAEAAARAEKMLTEAAAELEVVQGLHTEADARLARISAWDPERARDGMNKWVHQALMEDKTTFPGSTAYKHYAREGEQLYKRRRGMGYQEDPRETVGQARARIQAQLGQAGSKINRVNQRQRQTDQTYGQD